MLIFKVLEKRPEDILKTFRKDVCRVTSLGTKDVNFVTLVQMHFYCIIFSFISRPEDVHKGPKVTSGGWSSRDVPRMSILNKIAKRITAATFSVLIQQMCVLDTRKFVIAYSFSFGDTPYERPKNVPKWQLQLRRSDVLTTSI